MANQQEAAKFNALLQKPAAIKQFNELSSRVRLLSRTQNIKAADGELMAVCAYLVGKEFAGSAATREACTRLGCMSLKTFDRVEATVQTLLKPKEVPRNLTIYSLAKKYGFPSEELEMVQSVHSILHMSIPMELQDERIVCAIFEVICKILGHDSQGWIKAEMEIHEIEMKEMVMAVERVDSIYGGQIIAVIKGYREPGRPSRNRSSPMKRPPIPTPSKTGAAPLKRQAPEDAIQRQTPAKRRKAETTVRPVSPIQTVPSSRQSASPVPSTRSTPFSQQSDPSLHELFEEEDADEAARSEPNDEVFVEPLEEDGISSIESDLMEDTVLTPDLVANLDWTSLAELRRKAMVRKLRDPTSLHRVITKPVFVDRGFWNDHT